MKTAAIIVNYRTPESTERATTALLVELAGDGHVYVVDNDSGDGSFEHLRRAAETRGWGERVSVLEAPRNGGKGYGINLAVARALAQDDRPDYVYILDAHACPDAGSLARLLGFMDGHREAGIAGSVVHGPDGAEQGAAFRFPTLWSELASAAGVDALSRPLQRDVVSLAPREHREIDWVPGASMLVRREVFERAGLFDEGFFRYFEEIDFCRRARSAGWRCVYVADAPVRHVGSDATDPIDGGERFARHWFDSRHRYFLKHHGRAYAAACDVAWIAGYAIARARASLLERKTHHCPHALRDLLLSSLRDLTTLRLPAAHDAKVTPKSDEALCAARSLHDTRSADELRLLELLAEDFATHDRDLMQPGLWAIAAHRVGRRARTLEQERARKAIDGAYRVIATAADWVWGIHLPRSVQVGRRVRIWHSGCMVLSARAIGNDVHIRHDTTFGPAPRGTRDDDCDPRSLEDLPAIEDRADIGSGVCVLGAVTVGHDAMVGANSVVMKSVPPHATVLGVPARIIPA